MDENSFAKKDYQKEPESRQPKEIASFKNILTACVRALLPQ
jgi:hypothetical protein